MAQIMQDLPINCKLPSHCYEVADLKSSGDSPEKVSPLSVQLATYPAACDNSSHSLLKDLVTLMNNVLWYEIKLCWVKLTDELIFYVIRFVDEFLDY